MNSKKSHLFPFIVIGIFILMLATSCAVQKPEPEPSITLIEGMFTDVYEDANGLHLVLPVKSEILIELVDETEVYFFALEGSEHEIRHFRTKQGSFVVLNDELYDINKY